MAKIIFIIIELIVLGISVIMIYDARKIATKTFSSNETNNESIENSWFYCSNNKLTNDIYYENKNVRNKILILFSK